MAAVTLGKFYADDVALRLYAAGEHTANFIVHCVGITEPELQPLKARKNLVSQAGVVGIFMVKERKGHPITEAIKELLDGGIWKKVMDYRNTWVHAQPPLLEGLGIVYARESDAIRPAETTESGAAESFLTAGGDKPGMTVDDLIGQVSEASGRFVSYMRRLFDAFQAELEAQDIINL